MGQWEIGRALRLADGIWRVQCQRIERARSFANIATQEEHHKKQTFQEEYIAFLKKNNVAYDEPYIWD
jgi:hypothetical protein